MRVRVSVCARVNTTEGIANAARLQWDPQAAQLVSSCHLERLVKAG